jgi:hypothetical protein
MDEILCEKCKLDDYDGPSLDQEFLYPQWCSYCGKIVPVKLSPKGLKKIALRVDAAIDAWLENNHHHTHESERKARELWETYGCLVHSVEVTQED